MGLIGDCSFAGLESMLDRIENRGSPQQVEKLMKNIANELGNTVLSQVIELTPVGMYNEGAE